MKLKIVNSQTNKHSDIVTAVGWSSNNELYSIGDDRKISRWSGDGEHLGALQTSLFDTSKQQNTSNGAASSETLFITSIHFLPGRNGTNDTFALSGSDGKFYLCSKNGRVEKVVEAHKGACLAVKWNYEGSALVTAGEDGQAKIYSRSGMLRSVLVQTNYPLYAIAWSPENDAVLYSNGRNLIIKPLQPAQKPTTWKAHDAPVLALDWNLSTDLIVSGAEDRKYKIWDAYGQCLYTSQAHDHPITSVSFCPSGEYFAVGSHNLIRVCDSAGWSYAMSRPKCGSIYSIAWTPDGSQFCAGSGDGSVMFGGVLGWRWEWKNYEIEMVNEHHLRVVDVASSAVENLDFRDRVLKFNLDFGHAVVTTTSQIYVYSQRNWNTPSVIDLTGGGRVTTIKQSPQYFLVVDTVNGIQVYTYEGRLISAPKFPGMRTELLSSNVVALSNDTIAVRDHADEKVVYMFELTTGRPIHEQPFKHTSEISNLQLSQTSASIRMLCILDKNRDLYVTPCMKPDPKKLAPNVESFSWHEDTNMLAAVADGKFVCWLHPNVVFVDEDITPLTVVTKDAASIGHGAKFLNFTGTQSTLRRADGALVSARNVSPFPGMLHEIVRKKQWEEAIRLCRYAKSKELWACLASMALAANELNTAEVAYAAIDEVQKVQYVCYIKEIASMEARSAELALLRRQPKEAESILLGAGLIYRAIRMWMQLYNWDRALEIAVKYKTHVDTVLYFRQRYLQDMGMKETNKKFIQYSQGIEIDVEKIQAKIQMEGI